MSGERLATDLGAEREIDLARWRDAALAYWWLAVAGLVAGIIAGSVYALSGGTTYKASALIARGQAFNPAGTSSVLGYLSSPAAIQAYATSPEALATVAAKAGMSVGELRGHVSTATLTDNGQASTINTNSVLVQITVKLNKPKRAVDAANALAALIKRVTTSDYVRQSISLYNVRLGNYGARVKTLQGRIQSLNDTLASSGNLQPLDRLVLVSELDQAEATLGQTLDSQSTTQQELTLAEDVEQTQLIQKAQAEKTAGRSRRNSSVTGGLIGLILGAIVATVYGLRTTRTRSD